MSDFQTSTLEDMCELVIDCPHFTPEWTTKGFLVIRNQNIRNGRLDLSDKSFTHKEDFERRITRAKPQEGDIIFTREAPMGEVCIIPEGLECCVGQRQVLLRPKADIDGKYLFFALQSPYVRHQIFWNEGTGSTVSNVRIPVLKALKIPRQPNETTIARILSSLDDKIELNRRMNETLEEMARVIFKDWFIDFGPTRAKQEGRAPYLPACIWSLFPGAIDAETRLPERWEPSKVEDFMELAYGKSLTAKNRRPGHVVVYGSGGKNGFHDEALISSPAVIVGRKGTVGSIYWEERPIFPIDTVFYVVPKKTSLLFCYQLLLAQPLADMNTDAAVPVLNRNNAYRLEFPYPSSDLVNIYELAISPIWKKRGINLSETENLTETRDRLLPKLMSGEIRVKEAEKMVEEVL